MDVTAVVTGLTGLDADAAAGKFHEALSTLAADLASNSAGPLTALPLVGLQELHLMFRVGWNTPYQWRVRGQLPKEDLKLSGNPVWRVTTIWQWALETNRKIWWDPMAVVAPGGVEDANREAEPLNADRPVGVPA